MKQVWKLGALATILLAIWIGLLLRASDLPDRYSTLVPYLPIYAVIALGFYGIAMVAYGLLVFPLCPKEAVLLQQDIIEATDYLLKNGVAAGDS